MKKINFINKANKKMNENGLSFEEFLAQTNGQDVDELKKKADIFIALKEANREDARLYLEADKQHNEKSDLELKFKKQKFDEQSSICGLVLKAIAGIAIFVGGLCFDQFLDFISLLPSLIK